MPTKEKDHEVTFKIEDHFGVLSSSNTGWTRELNLVAWNGCPPKFDLRDWDREHKVMSRGITMTRDEIDVLSQILNSMEPA